MLHALVGSRGYSSSSFSHPRVIPPGEHSACFSFLLRSNQLLAGCTANERKSTRIIATAACHDCRATTRSIEIHRWRHYDQSSVDRNDRVRMFLRDKDWFGFLGTTRGWWMSRRSRSIWVIVLMLDSLILVVVSGVIGASCAILGDLVKIFIYLRVCGNFSLLELEIQVWRIKDYLFKIIINKFWIIFTCVLME